MSRRISRSRSSQVWRPCSCDVLSLSKSLSMPPWLSRASKSLFLTRFESCSASMPKPFFFAFSPVGPCVSSVEPCFSRWTLSSASHKVKIRCRRKAKKKDQENHTQEAASSFEKQHHSEITLKLMQITTYYRKRKFRFGASPNPKSSQNFISATRNSELGCNVKKSLRSTNLCAAFVTFFPFFQLLRTLAYHNPKEPQNFSTWLQIHHHSKLFPNSG